MYSLPSEPGSIGHTLDAGFKLYVVSFKQVLVLGILAAISLTVPLHVLILAAATLPQTGATPGVAKIVTSVVGFIACMLLYMCFYLAIICRVGGIAYGQSIALGACMTTGLRRLFAVIVATILYSLAVMGGFLVLIIPGLILWVSLIFYTFCIILEGDGMLESLRHSHRLVWGNWWRTFVICSVFFIVYYVIYLAIQVPFLIVDQIVFSTEFGTVPGFGAAILSMFGDIVATVITFPLMAAVFVAVFHDLKLRTEGQDLEARVEALTASA